MEHDLAKKVWIVVGALAMVLVVGSQQSEAREPRSLLLPGWSRINRRHA